MWTCCWVAIFGCPRHVTVERMGTSTSLFVQDLQSYAHFKQEHPLEESIGGCGPSELVINPNHADFFFPLNYK
jgi:hypothetical protein